MDTEVLFMNVPATIRLSDYQNCYRYILSPILDLGMIFFFFLTYRNYKKEKKNWF